MRSAQAAGFAIKRVTLTEKGFTCDTWQLTGWLDGRRIRKQFKSREGALGEQNRLEVEAANAAQLIRTVHTRLTPAQLAEAESAVTRLGNTSLSMAVDWYLKNYVQPPADVSLKIAREAFLAERERHIRTLALRDYRRTLERFDEFLPGRMVHEVTTADAERFLASRNIGPKRWNNLRGDLHAFFNFALKAPREWVRKNPVTPINVFKISRGLPEILTVETARELMAYVETYAGGPQSGLPAGCLVPYFALTMFAGIRPSVPDGEVCKLGQHPNVAKLVDATMGVIRITPEIAKTKDVRQITIQPNLAAWLARYPIDRYPIVPKNKRRLIQHVREKFALSGDVLRHTFVSAHVAKFRSMGDTALQAGNSEAMVRRHYLNLVSEADADAFWGIRPLK